MRTRLAPDRRRAEILETARRLIGERGLASTEMEDIRLACGISRGGLYHHFPGKRAILEALVAEEVAAIAAVLDDETLAPIPALLAAGSVHLGAGGGVLAGLRDIAERLDYLSALDQALAAHLRAPLAARLRDAVAPGVDPAHVAELFLTVTAHGNRREILGDWTGREAAAFAATALRALAPLLAAPSELDPIISSLHAKATSP